MYTSENLQAMGSIYAQLTQLKGFNDPYQGAVWYVSAKKYHNNDQTNYALYIRWIKSGNW